MSIRYLAEELYRLTRQVEELEKTLAAIGVDDLKRRSRLEMELLKAKQELAHMRAVLEAKKEPPRI
jgi:hypothetical protein